MVQTKVGKCPWCERHNVTLFFTYGLVDGKLWTEWVCAECRQITRNLQRGERGWATMI